MIVVKLELWPGGDESRKEDLGTAQVVNTAVSSPDMGSYDVRLLKGAKYSRHAGDIWKQGTVLRFPRLSEHWGPWELLALALEATVGRRVADLKRYLAVERTGRPVEMIGSSEEG